MTLEQNQISTPAPTITDSPPATPTAGKSKLVLMLLIIIMGLALVIAYLSYQLIMCQGTMTKCNVFTIDDDTTLKEVEPSQESATTLGFDFLAAPGGATLTSAQLTDLKEYLPSERYYVLIIEAQNGNYFMFHYRATDEDTYTGTCVYGECLAGRFFLKSVGESWTDWLAYPNQSAPECQELVAYSFPSNWSDEYDHLNLCYNPNDQKYYPYTGPNGDYGS